jgi:prepilin-type N-terminal cleavage/methylation domain-containing protein
VNARHAPSGFTDSIIRIGPVDGAPIGRHAAGMKTSAVRRPAPASKRARQGGFTLTEIMIVVLIISILAMMGRVAVQRVYLRSRAAAYWNDCRVFSEAFNRYAQEKGDFPPDQNGAGLFPPNMTGYLNPTQWLRKTPLGGTYDWDNRTASNSTGVKFNAVIRVNSCNWTTANLLMIDKWYDDGNLATGNFRVTDGGATVLFISEPLKQ